MPARLLGDEDRNAPGRVSRLEWQLSRDADNFRAGNAEF
jgi:hypothetical protein